MYVVSKSQLKSQLLAYLRKVEKEKKPLVITHEGKPVLKVSPYKQDPQQVLQSLKGSVISYVNPTQPVGENDWEILS
jgi:prevent-host-death family protein